MKYIKNKFEFKGNLIVEHNSTVLDTIEYNDETLTVNLYNNVGGFKPYIDLITADGELFEDLSTMLENNDLFNAVWILDSGVHKEVADILVNNNKLMRSEQTTNQGYNTYRIYDISPI
jgi:hypothetical protein